LLAGCDKGDKATAEPGGQRGTPPPPPAESAAKAGACNGGGGEIKDAIAAPLLPRAAGGFCLNPDGAAQIFGEKAAKPINGICELFDGGCEQYLKLSLKRLVRVDYVDGAGGGATVTADVQQYASPEHALALFTARVTSGDDPARADMAKPVAWGPLAAMGTGTVYMWRGAYVVELSYVSPAESGDQNKLKASSDKILPVLGKAILEKLPGTSTLPPALRRLPVAEQIPLGMTYAIDGALGADGTGQHATKFYSEGGKRWRMLGIVKDDADQAKDVLKTFLKKKGATEEKGLGDGAVRLMVQDGEGSPKSEWIVARKGAVLMGMGDEPYALKPGASAAEHDKVCLPKDEKLKKLRAALDAPADGK
jgi:hypothetical protein